jgi:large subunit ribosomal protein L9
MKILLLETVKSLGVFSDMINVKPGFARNYLIKYGKAVFYNDKNIAIFKKQKNTLEKNYEKAILDNIQKYKKLKQIDLIIKKKTIDGEKLYGSIKENELLEEIKKFDISFKKTEFNKKIYIRKIGIHNIEIKLNPGNINFNLAVIVEKLQK